MIRLQKPINGFQNLTSSLQASVMATKLCAKHVWTGACWETAAPQSVTRCEICPRAQSHTVRP